jgi:hypothetical protein
MPVAHHVIVSSTKTSRSHPHDVPRFDVLSDGCPSGARSIDHREVTPAMPNRFARACSYPQNSSDLRALPVQLPAHGSRFSTHPIAFGDRAVFGSFHAAVARAFGLPRNKLTDRFPKR